jgi:hypothetical protein
VIYQYDSRLDRFTNSARVITIDAVTYGIDFRTNGGIIVAEPSIREGSAYTIDIKYPLSKMPQELVDRLVKYQTREANTSKLPKNQTVCKPALKPTFESLQEAENTYTRHEIESFVSKLSKDRADDYDSWIHVGICLRNIQMLSQGEFDLFDIFETFSKQSTKYQIGCCNKVWNCLTVVNNQLAMGSLLYWCQQDNPDFSLNPKGKC